ncbi:MAG: hypothetical protein JXR78_06615 [Victivallales bacterium]|nr:hypothetical protein [Victivallales bacterium]
MNELTAEVIPVDRLTPELREGMYRLMCEHFSRVERSSFEHDLSDKEWVALLRDENGILGGFSIMAVMHAKVNGVAVRAFYSGDTIVTQHCRQLFSLERMCMPFIYHRVLQQPQFRWYWFIICKGYRTYRYLQVHFRRYWPALDVVTPPFEAEVLNTLALSRFGDDFNSETGIIATPNDYWLRDGIGDITSRELQKPHIRFFASMNPCWKTGTQLACLTELSIENLHRMSWRMVRKELDAM